MTDNTELPLTSEAPSTDTFELPQLRDGFQRLWTPHRMAYIKGGQGQFGDDAADCPFCLAPEHSDEEALIVHRGEHNYVLLNLYPYNAGHLLICPYRHLADYPDLEAPALAEFSALTQQAMRVLRAALKPSGFNLGINQGNIGGAGIAAHLHQHVVPRWAGDGNFMPIIAQTKVISQTLEQMQAVIAQAWIRS